MHQTTTLLSVTLQTGSIDSTATDSQDPRARLYRTIRDNFLSHLSSQSNCPVRWAKRTYDWMYCSQKSAFAATFGSSGGNDAHAFVRSVGKGKSVQRGIGYPPGACHNFAFNASLLNEEVQSFLDGVGIGCAQCTGCKRTHLSDRLPECEGASSVHYLYDCHRRYRRDALGPLDSGLRLPPCISLASCSLYLQDAPLERGVALSRRPA